MPLPLQEKTALFSDTANHNLIRIRLFCVNHADPHSSQSNQAFVIDVPHRFGLAFSCIRDLKEEVSEDESTDARKVLKVLNLALHRHPVAFYLRSRSANIVGHRAQHKSDVSITHIECAGDRDNGSGPALKLGRVPEAHP